MTTRMRLQAAAVGLGAALPALFSTQVAAASTVPEPLPKVVQPTKVPTPATSYCSTTVLTAAQLRAHQLSEIVCYASLAESLDAVGLHVASTSATGPATNSIDPGLLAIHYDLSGGQGYTQLAVSGTQCGGGGISIAADSPWNDMFSSTRHGACSRIKHYENPGYQGNVCTTFGAPDTVNNFDNCANNVVMNNRVSSIQYFTAP